MRHRRIVISHQDKPSFVRLLRRIVDEIGIQEVHLSDRGPTRPGPLMVGQEPRFDIPLSGIKHMEFAAGGELRHVHLRPGHIHYAPPLHWKWPHWDEEHEMSSLVVRQDHLRLTYIDSARHRDDRGQGMAYIFYHSSRPLCEAGQTAVRALTMAARQGNGPALRPLAEAVLRLALGTLEQDAQQPQSRARSTWQRIVDHLQDHFADPIDRASVARSFDLGPTYLSRLFRQQGDEGFTAHLRRLRLEHAGLLLRNTSMTLDEITPLCGYSSTTFLIGAFKKHYGVTPGVYRGREGVS